MRNVFIVLFPLLLLPQITYATSGSDIVDCAGCFAQKWNWASWQCDVHCDVQTSKYGKWLIPRWFPIKYHFELLWVTSSLLCLSVTVKDFKEGIWFAWHVMSNMTSQSDRLLFWIWYRLLYVISNRMKDYAEPAHGLHSNGMPKLRTCLENIQSK